MSQKDIECLEKTFNGKWKKVPILKLHLKDQQPSLVNVRSIYLRGSSFLKQRSTVAPNPRHIAANSTAMYLIIREKKHMKP